MGKHYSHLSLEERERIAVWKARGWPLRRIARKLGRSHTSLMRELKRYPLSFYRPSVAHQKALSKRGGTRPVLNVLVERKSRWVKLTRLQQNTALLTFQAILRGLGGLSRKLRRSITYDNGSENALHQAINQVLKSRSYFCEPYHSWEKGTVENTNGLVRRFIPKETNLARLTDQQIKKIEDLLNNRPRKCLGYQTPNEVFQTSGGALQS